MGNVTVGIQVARCTCMLCNRKDGTVQLVAKIITEADNRLVITAFLAHIWDIPEIRESCFAVSEVTRAILPE